MLGLAPRSRRPLAAAVSKISNFGVGATLARAAGVRDWDPTDEVFLAGDDGPTAPDAADEGPTSPIVLDDHTTRQRCEFEEDTVEEYFV